MREWFESGEEWCLSGCLCRCATKITNSQGEKDRHKRNGRSGEHTVTIDSLTWSKDADGDNDTYVVSSDVVEDDGSDEDDENVDEDMITDDEDDEDNIMDDEDDVEDDGDDSPSDPSNDEGGLSSIDGGSTGSRARDWGVEMIDSEW